MFCKKCGKEIPDDTKYCNFCGAEQSAAALTTNVPQDTSPTPKNNTKLIIIIAVLAVAFILGVFIIAPSLSGDRNNTSAVTSSGTLTVNGDEENSIFTSTVSAETSGTTLESLIPENSDNRGGDVYSASLGEGGIFTVSFGYYRDSPKVLYNFTGSIEVEKTNASYNEIKKECETFEKRANAFNDSDNVRIKCKENDTGMEVLLYIDKLADADRLERVKLAADFIGVKDTEGAFYFDSVVSQLTEIGFERGIPN